MRRGMRRTATATGGLGRIATAGKRGLVIAAAAALTAGLPATAGATHRGPLASPFLSSAPVVLSLKPAEGAQSGGTKVKIKGEHLKGATIVDFGSTPVTLAKPNKSETALTAVSPAGTGTVDITVTTPEGSSEPVPADLFAYRSTSPEVSKISPTQGPAKAQRKVAINGSGFTGATAVHFGSISVPFKEVKGTRITVTAPIAQETGPVDITVTTPQGTSEATPGDRYDFEAEVPAVEETSPEIGSTGETVTLEGEGFVGTSAVMFGGTPASFEVVNDVEIRAVVPAHSSERVAITITTPLGTTEEACGNPMVCKPVAHFKFRPSITSVSPGSGPLAGGTPVTITGTNLSNTNRIEFGKNNASSLECSETSCTVLAPAAKTAGKVTVKAHVEAGYKPPEDFSIVTEATQFTYE
jgi:IPT/TIG domain